MTINWYVGSDWSILPSGGNSLGAEKDANINALKMALMAFIANHHGRFNDECHLCNVGRQALTDFESLNPQVKRD